MTQCLEEFNSLLFIPNLFCSDTITIRGGGQLVHLPFPLAFCLLILVILITPSPLSGVCKFWAAPTNIPSDGCKGSTKITLIHQTGPELGMSTLYNKAVLLHPERVFPLAIVFLVKSYLHLKDLSLIRQQWKTLLREFIAFLGWSQKPNWCFLFQ
jgi:hypothetical protein